LSLGEGGLEWDHSQLLTFGTDDTKFTCADTAVRAGVADGGLLRNEWTARASVPDVQVLISGQKYPTHPGLQVPLGYPASGLCQGFV